MNRLPSIPGIAHRIGRAVGAVLAVGVIGLGSGNATAAQAPIYKCLDRNLGLVYTDIPCKDGERMDDLRAGDADPAAVARLERERDALDRSIAQRITDQRRAALQRTYAPAPEYYAGYDDYAGDGLRRLRPFWDVRRLRISGSIADGAAARRQRAERPPQRTAGRRPQPDARVAPVIRAGIVLALAFVANACATSSMPVNAPPGIATELAPSGTLRAAINYGNPILASKDPATGEPRGVSVDLSRELARRLGVPLELVTYDAAGKVTDNATTGAWDIAFVAIDPKRAADMDYSAPYVLIEGAFVVPQGSPIRANDDVDREGVRVVAAKGSAYDLYLAREFKKATIVHVATSQEVVAAMVAQRIDAGAGVKQQLEASARTIPGVRLLDGRFMVIQQAMATPKGRPAGARYLAAFVEDMKASGFVAEALRKHGIDGAAVAPPAAR